MREYVSGKKESKHPEFLIQPHIQPHQDPIFFSLAAEPQGIAAMPPAPLYGDQQWLDRGIDALGIKESIFVRPEFRTGEVIKQFLMYGCTNVSVCVCVFYPGLGNSWAYACKS